MLHQWDSSRDYDPSPRLERIRAALLAINSADDERNPPETGIMERELKRIKNGRLYLSERVSGHARIHQKWPSFRFAPSATNVRKRVRSGNSN